MARHMGALLLTLALLLSPVAGAEDALLEAESGDQTERVLSILEGSKQDPATFEDYDKLATIAYAKGEYDEALAYLDECIALAGEDNAEVLGALYTQKGVILRIQKKTEEAMAALDQAADYTPRSVQMLSLRAEINLDEKAYGPASTDLEAYVALLPEDADAWAKLATAYRALGQKDKAESARQRVQALSEDSASALLTAARRSALYGDLETAEAGFLQYLAQSTDEGGAVHFLLAGIRMELGKLEEAIRDLETAMALDYPEPGVCYEYLSSCYFMLEDYAKALETGRRAVASGDEILYEAIYQRMGIAALMQRKPDEAAAHFTRALEYNDDLEGVRYYRGIALMEDAAPEDAIADFTESIARGEQVQRCLYNRGLCYLETDNLPKGISDLEKAMNMTDEADIAAAAEEVLWQMAMQMITTPEE